MPRGRPKKSVVESAVAESEVVESVKESQETQPEKKPEGKATFEEMKNDNRYYFAGAKFYCVICNQPVSSEWTVRDGEPFELFHLHRECYK
jgi:hypothetical protein